MTKSVITLLLLVFIFVACDDEERASPLVTPATLEYDFATSNEGWIGGFSDYAIGDDALFELSSTRAPLPEPLDDNQSALKISGNNRSDDLFMFVKKRIQGLLPRQTYEITFDIELASDAPDGGAGIGGPPGESVTLKAGATGDQPIVLERDGAFQMSIDKGEQSQAGEDMIVLGNVANGTEDFIYTLISRDNKQTSFKATASGDGDLWLIIGTDSGFEGVTTLYYNRITVTIE